jgi:hypothetical protein
MKTKIYVFVGFLVVLAGCAGPIEKKEISQSVTNIYRQDINLIPHERSGNFDARKKTQRISHMMAWINISRD